MTCKGYGIVGFVCACLTMYNETSLIRPLLYINLYLASSNRVQYGNTCIPWSIIIPCMYIMFSDPTHNNYIHGYWTHNNIIGWHVLWGLDWYGPTLCNHYQCHCDPFISVILHYWRIKFCYTGIWLVNEVTDNLEIVLLLQLLYNIIIANTVTTVQKVDFKANFFS